MGEGNTACPRPEKRSMTVYFENLKTYTENHGTILPIKDGMMR